MNVSLLQRSLKTRVTLFTLAIFVLSLWGLGWYAVRTLRADMEQMLSDQQLSAVGLVAANINQELLERRSALEQLVKRYDAMSFRNVSELQADLEDRLVIRQLFNGGLFITDAAGTTIASVPLAANRIGINYMFRDHVAAAVGAGMPAISSLMVGKALKVPVFGIAVPIRDPRGDVVGSLVGVINLDATNFLDKIAANPYGKTGGYIINAPQQRLIITATDKRRIMETLPPRGANWLIDRFIDGYEGSGVVVNPLGVEVLASAKGIPVAGWYVAALLPTAEAFAPIRDMQQRMLLATLLLTLAAGILTWRMLRRQLAPIELAAKAIAARSGVDITSDPLPNTTRDEIGALIGGFNRLLVNYQRKQTMLTRTEGIAHVGSWEWDVATDTTRWSDEMFRIFQRAPAEGAPTFAEHPELYLPEDMQRLKDAVDAAVTRGTPYELELRAIRGDGETRICLARGHVDADAGNHVTRLYGSLQDITERKAAEAALQGFSRDFEAFLDQTTDFVYFKDIDSRIRFCSQTLAGITGHRNWREMVGKHDREIFPPATAKIYEDEERPVIAEGRALLDKVDPYYDADGNTGYVQTNKWPLFDDDGKVAGIFGISRDITERKRVENELLELAERYRLANKATNDVIWDWDVIPDTQRWSEAGIAVFGWTEIVEHPVSAHWWVERVHPDDRERVHESFFEVVNNPEIDVWQGEYRFRKADGVFADVMDRGYVLRDECGKAIRMIGAMQDITERKRIEAELEQYRDHLEKLVLERTQELEAARIAAEAASRAKSTFLANMSHELRTPMNGVMGMLELASRRMTDPKGLEQLGKARGAADHLLGVLNDILDISKIEAERMVFEDRPMEIADIVDNLRSVLGHKATQKGLRLETDISAALADQRLKGDPLRLGQILLNLAGNAIKFTEQGGVTLRARVLAETPEGVMVRFEISDTGIGIDAEAQARLFTAFEQADNSMTRKYGGTGLGLAISKRLVQLMGGEIGVESTPGAGSTFWFSVPLARRDAGAVPPVPTFENAEARLRRDYPGTRVLLVEDEPVNREVACFQLEAVGFSVDLAEDGQQALELARQNTYALILMDMQMPVMNGVEATRAIRTDSLNRDTPILAMTANAFEEDRQACLAAGMNEHLTKPVVPQRLYETLLQWLPVSR